MSVSKYKFVSPGVFVDEIDNSQLPRLPEAVGPVIIGRTERGPGMVPVKVESLSEFVEVFGNPIPGGKTGDVWRDGNYTAPTYAAYAAQAWLRNNGPATIVRLLGDQHGEASAAGEAGWKTDATLTTTESTSGGAYGLFVIDSASFDENAAGYGINNRTGTLAAVFYLNEGSIALSGTMSGTAALPLAIDSHIGAASSYFVESTSQRSFRVVVYDSSGIVKENTVINFDESSPKFARTVLNTNPTLVESGHTTADERKTYWLGETYENDLSTYATGTAQYGILLGLKGTHLSSTPDLSDFTGKSSTRAETGWVFSQDTRTYAEDLLYDPIGLSGDDVTKLFKFKTLSGGEWEQTHIKISIQDVKASTNTFNPYGSFTVVVRDIRDNDRSPKVLEKFTSCNLNPNSDNYIAKKIGDTRREWDETERRYIEHGNYANKSKFIYVVMAKATYEAELLPFGFYGPPVFRGFSLKSGSLAPLAYSGSKADPPGGTPKYAASYTKRDAFENAAGPIVVGSASLPIERGLAREGAAGLNPFGVPMGGGMHSSTALAAIHSGVTASFLFPTVPLRGTSKEGNLGKDSDAYFGADTTNGGALTFDKTIIDKVRGKPYGIDSFSATGSMEYSWVFSLDDLKATSTGAKAATWASGSRTAGTSFTAVSSSWKEVLDNGYNRFTMLLHGGMDGVDITEREPFNNRVLSTNEGEKTNYAFNSVKKAIDSVRDPEVVEMNLATIPGVTNHTLTTALINTCEERGDALAIIDPKGGFVPDTENSDGDESNIGSVTTTVNNLKDRSLNSSYGCAYYPWVQILDTINGGTLWVPPSIVALGTFSSTQRRSELWFAPAGFTRGGLTVGSAGVPVVGVRQKLTSDERDDLYEANINPIASFPAEGIVIFGQKTLQVVPSALDRINVRRLMIFVKREISRIAATTLFEPNVQETWDNFRNRAEPLLRSIKTRLGLTDFKLVLDETTTTPDLVDRNIMYAKVFLKPARAIEFIAVDFVITNTGAAFED